MIADNGRGELAGPLISGVRRRASEKAGCGALLCPTIHKLGGQQVPSIRVPLHKLVAIAIALAETIACFVLEKSLAFAMTVAAGALGAVALVWFPEFFGGLTGWGTRVPVDQPSPPKLIAGMGWLFLLGLPVLVFLLADNPL